MDNFHSTVLQRHDDEDERERERENRHQRDILNPSTNSSTVVAAPAPPPPPRHSNFSLRSPTQTEFHQSSRPVLHNPFMTSGGGPIAPPSLVGSSGAPTGMLQGPPLSPLHPPAGYYPPPQQPELHPAQTREKMGTSSYYDPTTDTTKERRVSDTGSWHNAAQVTTPKVSF
jgi:chromatin-remodeling ATPase INO80